ncbi:MAG: nucleoside-diphosphate sugar epimerase/dehydratase [Flavobacteriaceae bacterium]
MRLLEKIRKSDIYTSSWVVLLIDISLIVQTFFIANLIFYNFKLSIYGSYIFHQLPFVILFALISILIVGSHKGIVRHTGVNDAISVFITATLFVFLSVTIVYINRNLGFYRIKLFFPHSISILLIHYLLNIIVLIASRFIFKRIYQLLIIGRKKNKKILIYGAGDSGLITYATLTNNKRTSYNVFGFIDDNPSKRGKQFNRTKVYDSSDITSDFIEKHNIDEVIISIQNIEPSKLFNISDKLVSKNVIVKIVPPVEQWIDGDLNVSQIKEINIEDLLSRSPINIENPIVKKELLNKTILITGAAGSIGSEIAKQIVQYNYKQLFILDQAESPLYDLQQDLKRNDIHNFKTIICDIRNQFKLKEFFKTNSIDIIFHAAAYKHVPLMESNPYEAVHTNVYGTKNLMDLAVTYNVEKFVMVSTDKAVNPTNVMGATKRITEMYAKCLHEKTKTKFITTRFGNVLGSNGSVIPLFKKQIEQGGPLTVTHKDITRYFMTIPEACQLVLEAGAMGKGGEIFVFDMGESVKIVDLAKKMIQLSGYNYPNDIDIEFVGLRPGEKLYEELLGDKENTLPTYNDKIMIAKVHDINCDLVISKINILASVNGQTIKEIVSKIKEIVPEYISKNSDFEALDS